MNLKINIESDSLNQVKKHINTSHGLSMLALCMLDIHHKTLNVEISFDDELSLINTSEQLLATFLKCESNKVMLRSYKVEGKFLDSYLDIKLSDITTQPVSPNEYAGNSKVILHCSINEKKHEYYFYRLNESGPRILTLVVPTEELSIDEKEL
jgi:hypothetical protein